MERGVSTPLVPLLPTEEGRLGLLWGSLCSSTCLEWFCCGLGGALTAPSPSWKEAGKQEETLHGWSGRCLPDVQAARPPHPSWLRAPSLVGS